MPLVSFVSLQTRIIHHIDSFLSFFVKRFTYQKTSMGSICCGSFTLSLLQSLTLFKVASIKFIQKKSNEQTFRIGCWPTFQWNENKTVNILFLLEIHRHLIDNKIICIEKENGNFRHCSRIAAILRNRSSDKSKHQNQK